MKLLEKTVFLVTMLMYLDYQFTVRYWKKKETNPGSVQKIVRTFEVGSIRLVRFYIVFKYKKL